jgi:hypothetical protein
MNVQKAGRREGEVANWNYDVARYFGALAVLASSGTSAAVFLNGWPHQALGNELRRCFSSGVAERM